MRCDRDGRAAISSGRTSSYRQLFPRQKRPHHRCRVWQMVGGQKYQARRKLRRSCTTLRHWLNYTDVDLIGFHGQTLGPCAGVQGTFAGRRRSCVWRDSYGVARDLGFSQRRCAFGGDRVCAACAVLSHACARYGGAGPGPSPSEPRWRGKPDVGDPALPCPKRWGPYWHLTRPANAPINGTDADAPLAAFDEGQDLLRAEQG